MVNKLNILIIAGVLSFTVSCYRTTDTTSLKNEILETEKEFNNAVKEHGIKKAFVQYAAEEAVLVRRERVIKGKKSIAEYFDNLPYKNISLIWDPGFVDVSDSGDMGYTYGEYKFSAVDTTGKKVKTEGIFHTVWKKQKDGSWKYVYD